MRKSLLIIAAASAILAGPALPSSSAQAAPVGQKAIADVAASVGPVEQAAYVCGWRRGGEVCWRRPGPGWVPHAYYWGGPRYWGGGPRFWGGPRHYGWRGYGPRARYGWGRW